MTKDLKHSTRQRFVALEFGYPPAGQGKDDPGQGNRVSRKLIAEKLVRLAEMVRNLKQHGLEEGVSTRLLVYAARLMVAGASHPGRPASRRLSGP